MKRLLGVSLCLCLVSGLTFADTFGTGASQFKIDFVRISGATNPTSGYGIVQNDYRMGKFEITNDQWDKFKASMAPMQVTGSPSYAYQYNSYWTGASVPTNTVSWYEAAQFVNWLNTSTNHAPAYKFGGTEGTSNYTLEVWQPGDTGYSAANPYRNSNAYYFLPTENEWVKAAYWNGTRLQTWATINDTQPVAGVDSRYGSLAGGPWAVGSGSEELNGTFDMMGNVCEWTESPWSSGNYLSGSPRASRGGLFYYDSSYLRSSYRVNTYAYDEDSGLGFRVAAVVPEPCSLMMISLGGLVLVRRRRFSR